MGFTKERFFEYLNSDGTQPLLDPKGYLMWKMLLISDISKGINGFTHKKLPFDNNSKNNKDEIEEWIQEHYNTKFPNNKNSDESINDIKTNNPQIDNFLSKIMQMNEIAEKYSMCKICNKQIIFGAKCCGTYWHNDYNDEMQKDYVSVQK